MLSFYRFRETNASESEEDEDADVMESQNNENGSRVRFDDRDNDSFEDVAEWVEESNGYIVHQPVHSLEEVT